MAVPDFIVSRFERIQTERKPDLCVMECSDAETGEVRYLICSVLQVAGVYHLAPLGEVFDAERQDRVFDSVIAP